MSDVLLRRGGAQDVRFLRDMLHHAYYWRERVPGSLVSRYVRGWGRPGDTAVIALEDGFPVGAAWFRVFRPPSRATASSTSRRRSSRSRSCRPSAATGSATSCCRRLIEKAKAAGYDRLSLSVEPGNPARKLYERHGFAVVDEGDEAWTMVAELASN